jgi:hypothetical protein
MHLIKDKTGYLEVASRTRLEKEVRTLASLNQPAPWGAQAENTRAEAPWSAGVTIPPWIFARRRACPTLRDGGGGGEQRGQAPRDEFVPKIYAVRVVAMAEPGVHSMVRPVAAPEAGVHSMIRSVATPEAGAYSVVRPVAAPEAGVNGVVGPVAPSACLKFRRSNPLHSKNSIGYVERWLRPSCAGPGIPLEHRQSCQQRLHRTARGNLRSAPT